MNEGVGNCCLYEYEMDIKTNRRMGDPESLHLGGEWGEGEKGRR